MFLADVLGSVVATRRYRETSAYRLFWVQPLDHTGEPAGDPQVALDTVLSGSGDRVFCVIGREASLAMDPPDRFSPVDLAIVGFVDRVDGDVEVAKPKKRSRPAKKKATRRKTATRRAASS